MDAVLMFCFSLCLVGFLGRLPLAFLFSSPLKLDSKNQKLAFLFFFLTELLLLSPHTQTGPTGKSLFSSSLQFDREQDFFGSHPAPLSSSCVVISGVLLEGKQRRTSVFTRLLFPSVDPGSATVTGSITRVSSFLTPPVIFLTKNKVLLDSLDQAVVETSIV